MKYEIKIEKSLKGYASTICNNRKRKAKKSSNFKKIIVKSELKMKNMTDTERNMTIVPGRVSMLNLAKGKMKKK